MANRPQTFDMIITPDDALKHDVVIDEIICKLRPAWPRADIIRELMQGGTVNVMVCYFLSGDTDKEDAIIVRTSGKRPSEQIYFKQNEYMVMQLCHQAGIDTEVLGTFSNGLIYRYVPGRVLETCGPEFFQEKYIRSMCRDLAKLHLIKPEDCELVDLDGKPAKYPQDMTIEDLLSKLLSAGPNSANIKAGINFQVTGVSLEEVNEELDWVDSHLGGLGMSRCITHNDLWAINMLFDGKTDSCKIIDYEFAAYGYECGEFCGLYEARDLFSTFDMLPPDVPPVTDELVRSWQKIYLEEKFTLQGRDLREITEDVLELFHVECAICSAVTFLVWVVEMYAAVDFSVKEVEHSIDTRLRPLMEMYKSRKQGLPQLIQKYRQLKNLP